MSRQPELRAAIRCAQAIAVLGIGMLALLASDAQAQDAPRLVIHQASYHFDRTQGFRESNPGIGLQLPDTDGRAWWQAGAYRNSVNRTTGYAVRGWNLARSVNSAGTLSAGVFVGAGTGYAVRVQEVTVTRGKPAAPCVAPKGEACPGATTTTETVRFNAPAGGIRPLGGLQATWDTGPVALHLVVTPTVRYGGTTRNYGAAALLVSFPLR